VSPEDLVLGATWLALTLYSVLGGADFGAGIWDAVTLGRMPKEDRDLLYRAIGPVWEANHVWLIFAVVLLFTAFPPAFAAASHALAVPLLAALVGIVVRGSAFAFRSYGPDTRRAERGWSIAFGAASTLAPLAMGAAAGAIAGGRIRATPDGRHKGDLLEFLGPMAALGALLACALCAYLAAAYLARESAALGTTERTGAWRRRAIIAGIASGALALLGLDVARSSAPALFAGLLSRGLPFVLVSGAAALGSFVAMWRGRFTAAAALSALAVGSVIGGWGAAQHPAVIPPDLTVAAVRAPREVLVATLVAAAIGGAALVPSLWFLLRTFKAARRAE
jgi:cytochrome d ubiquinol oxidase subunit II